MKTISFELPDTAFSALRKAPDDFVADMRLAAAAKWYEMGLISQEKGAEIAGLPRSQFIFALARFGTSAIQCTPEELREEFERG